MEDSGHDQPTAAEMPEEEEGSTASNQLPVCCQLDSKYPGMFRVLRAKGKVFSSGGFGVAIAVEDKAASPNEETDELEEEVTTKEDISQESTNEEEEKSTKETVVKTAPTKTSFDYLFLEEVLFLYERGLLECHTGDVNDDEGSIKKDDNPQKFRAAPELYAMLETFDLPMSSYLVFAHLRQQTFRVVRHSPQRLSLLQQLAEGGPDNNPRTKLRTLQLQLRQDVQQAPPPAILHHPTTPTFAFCVYKPDRNFAKRNPGLPDFLVAVTSWGQPALDYASIQNLLTQAQGIPIKLATVADSGTVIMFGITDFGVPPLDKPANGSAKS